jgi:predicted P-loop ATPase
MPRKTPSSGTFDPRVNPRLSAPHIEYFKARAVSEQTALAAGGAFSADAQDLAARLGYDVGSGGIVIPYAERGDGRPHVRCRPDAPLDGGAKWCIPAGPVRPWIPPPRLLAPEILRDVNFPLYFVEGPPKAMATLEAGLHTIALGGVEAGGHDTEAWEKKRARLHPELLDRIEWKGRVAVILLDSNRATNVGVARGEARLALCLKEAGAIVKVAELPRVSETEDQGPDDFIARAGAAALRELVAAARPADPLARIRHAAEEGPRAERGARMKALLQDLPFAAAVYLRTQIEGNAIVDQVGLELRRYGFGKKTLKEMLAWVRELAGEKAERRRQKAGEKPKAAAAPDAGDRAAAPAGPWHERLTYTPQGDVRASVANAITVLANHPDWAGVLGYNEHSHRIVFLAAPPFDPDDAPAAPPAAGAEWGDSDSVRTAAWLERHADISLKSYLVNEAVLVVAEQRRYHPLREYLRGLKWDGKPRLDLWLHAYFGVADTPYSRAVGAKWMISLAARAFRPGCFVKYLLNLEGSQDLGKSKSLRGLFGDDWFTDEIPDLAGKDAAIQLQGKWVVELSEMDALNRTETRRAKAFLSRQVDRFRPVHERYAKDHPRTAVFIGTINDTEYLRDATGGVRFWPVRCTKTDPEGLRAVRDQLFAEAVARFDAGEPWWLEDDAVVSQARAEQAERYQTDPWHEVIVDYLHDKRKITVQELLEKAIQSPKDRWDQRAKNRLSDILKTLGWVQRSIRVDLNPNPVRGYVKPEPVDGSSKPPEPPTDPPTPEGPVKTRESDRVDGVDGVDHARAYRRDFAEGSSPSNSCATKAPIATKPLSTPSTPSTIYKNKEDIGGYSVDGHVDGLNGKREVPSTSPRPGRTREEL